MKISPYAVNRFAEQAAADDPRVAQQLAAIGMIRMEDVRALSEEQLLDKLREVGMPIDRVEFERLAEGEISAIAVFDRLIERFRPDFSGTKKFNEDWAWMTCVRLWERWMPRPSCEMLDDEVQAGYDELKNGDSVVACIHWGNAWNHWIRIADERHCQTLEQLDELVSGTHYVSYWIEDFVEELDNAGEVTPVFHQRQFDLCRTVLHRFPNEDQVLTEIFRGGMAEAHSLLGERDISDRLFEEWLANDPQWGWGWIGWSDCYYYDLAENSPIDADKAEMLLKRGLEIEGLRDRNDVLERLADLYFDTDRDDEGHAVCAQMTEDDDEDEDDDAFEPSFRVRDSMTLHDRAIRYKRSIDFGDEGLPLSELERMSEVLRSGLDPFDDEDFDDEPILDDNLPRLAPNRKVGRNEPCPCGSGKKFKKCCGQK